MNGEPSVHAILVSYNGRDVLLECLASLAASRRGPDRVWVVDNASEDGTVDAVRDRFPECRILVNERNLGFAGGCNEGLRAAMAEGAELLLLLNQDTVVAPELLGRLTEFLVSRPAAGIVGPKTYSTKAAKEGKPILLYAGSWRGFPPLRQKIRGIEKPDSGQFDREAQVDYVWAHGMMIRGSALREVGLFDADFHMYYEDLDLCQRMQAGGHEIWYQPAAKMWHDTVDGARAVNSEYWRWAEKAKSMRVFHAKRYGPVRARLLTALTVSLELWRHLRKGHWRAVGHMAAAEWNHLWRRHR